MLTLLDDELEAVHGQLDDIATRTESQFILLSIAGENGSRYLCSDGLSKLAARLLMDALNHTDTLRHRVESASKAVGAGLPIPPFNWNSKGYQLINLKDDGQIAKHVKRFFGNLNQQNCKVLAKAWVRAIEPKKQTKYPYKYGDDCRPPWWPEDVRHKEPDHLMTPERIQLMYSILRLCSSNLNILADAIQTSWGLLNKGKSYSLDEIFYIITVLTGIENGSIVPKDPAFVPLIVNASNAEFPFMGLDQARRLASSGVFAGDDKVLEALILCAIPEASKDKLEEELNAIDVEGNEDNCDVIQQESVQMPLSSKTMDLASNSMTKALRSSSDDVSNNVQTDRQRPDEEDDTSSSDDGLISCNSNDEDVWQSPPTSLNLSPQSTILFSDVSIGSTTDTVNDASSSSQFSLYSDDSTSFIFDSNEKVKMETVDYLDSDADEDNDDYDYHALTFVGSTMNRTTTLVTTLPLPHDRHTDIHDWTSSYENHQYNQIQLGIDNRKRDIDDTGICDFQDKRRRYD